MNANTIPLQEVLPWSPGIPRNILVCDSVETDGSFVLSTMTARLFSSPSSMSSSFAPGPKGMSRQRSLSRKALWLSGNASTERQVASTLKKIGCDAGAAYLRNSKNNSSSEKQSCNGLAIRSLAVEISDHILGKKNESNDEFDAENYLKNVYKDIKAWLNDYDNNTEQEGKVAELDTSWIILDDATALASILGDTLVYCFVESLINLLGRKETSSTRQCGFIIRCSGDVDQMLHKIEGSEGKDHSGWVGAGGLAHKQAVNDTINRTLVPWERALEESVDVIVDVLPLLSGFSREAHGRLIFSKTPNGRGWKNVQSTRNNNPSAFALGSTNSKTAGSKWNKLIFNYCIQDNGARAIRLRAA
uniref:Uncharacterized protein n=1 Tax=Pseudo-nitzschia australis TaxID=44445 RepID=A0A6U9VQQ9_9STRA|mmetsp:Transcript_26536/g.58131  ORF Transcript_26536/g.58131 Transcript_26536/m.58131 type:complete len:360 (-) Transcript_26536:501-1580(-)